MSGKRELMVQVSQWQELPWLRHGFSTRHGGVSTVYGARPDEAESGDLNLGWTNDDDPTRVAENRRRLIAAVLDESDEGTNSEVRDSISAGEVPVLITVRQVHSAVSLVVPGGPLFRYSNFVREGRAVLEADGLMTATKGVLLGNQTADCVPVFVVDVKLRVVANFHAGWRGSAASIVERGVAKLTAEFGSRPEDMIAAIGPSIGACCYSVGEEVHEAFSSGFAYGAALFLQFEPGAALHLDLWEANRRQLLASGIAAERISLIGECTGCSGLPGRRRYFSHRKENGFTGRMLSVIGVA